MMNEERENRFIAYCVKHGYISMQRVKSLLASKDRGKNTIMLITRELGWNQQQALEIMRQACESSKMAGPANPADAPTLDTTKTIEQTPEFLDPANQKTHPMNIMGQARLGKYILVEKIGRGGMGIVYKAFHPELQSNFALKTILPSEIGPSNIKRFMREARIAARLKHPNIVRVYDVGETADQYYIVMDYIDGKDLSQVIKTEHLWPREVLSIMLKIIQALDYAHQQNVIHRDIKPGNIILANDKQRTPYLMDFGLAAILQEQTQLTRSGQLLGTPKYMSPEQAAGKVSHLDGRSDIYSLGAVLYELLCGKPVVRGKNNAAVLYKVLVEEVVPLTKRKASIPRDVEAITMKCLQKQVHQRYQTAAELAADVERYLRGEAVLARMPGFWSRTWRRVLRNWKTTLVISSLLCLLIGVGLWGWYQRPDQALIMLTGLLEQARSLEKQNNLKGAFDLYQSIRQQFPDHQQQADQGLQRIARRLQKQVTKAANLRECNCLADAIKTYLAVLNVDPSHSSARTGLLSALELLVSQGRLKQALEFYSSLRRLRPHDQQVISGIKQINIRIAATLEQARQLSKSNLEKALQLCARVIKWYPEHGAALRLYIRIKEAKEQRRKNARKFYDRALAIFWNPRLKETELIECRQLFEKALQQDPSFADAYFQAGRAAQRLFDHGSALAHYRRSLQCDPRLTAARYYLTSLELPLIVLQNQSAPLQQLDRKFRAIWGLKQTVKLPPPYNLGTDLYVVLAGAHYLLAKLHLLLRPQLLDNSQFAENYSESWRHCQQRCDLVIRKSPSFADAYFIRAQLYSYLVCMARDSTPWIKVVSDPRDLNQALQDCSRALYLDPLRVAGYALRGTIYRSVGAYQAAEQDFTRALMLKHAARPYFYLCRAACYVALRKPRLAMADLDRQIKSMRDYLQRSAGYLAYGQGQAYFWRAALKAYLGEQRLAQRDLAAYLALRARYMARYDDFVRAFIYLPLPATEKQALHAFAKFIRRNPQLFEPMKLLASMASLDDEKRIAELTRAIESVSDLFCVAPQLKRLRPAIQHFASIVQTMERQIMHRVGSNPTENFGIVIKSYLEHLKSTAQGRRRFQLINNIFHKAYPPLNAAFFLYFMQYLNERKNLRLLQTLHTLPNAELYYRRAIEYYLKDRLVQARDDLEAALDLQPHFMAAHYGLSTIYALLSVKDGNRASEYRQRALKHLQQAVVNGWSHIREYTLHDPEFRVLHLDSYLTPTRLRTWHSQQQQVQEHVARLRQETQELLRGGKYLRALRLLYQSGYPRALRKLTAITEQKVMQFLGSQLTPQNEAALDQQVERYLGKKGRLQWQWAKMEWRLAKNRSRLHKQH